jgi:hypothetical protein
MTVKLFEVRDRGTTIPAIGVDCSSAEADGRDYLLLRRAGYGPDRCILFGPLAGGDFTYDPYEHKSLRTIPAAHVYVEKEWDNLKSGDIIDVQFIVGETTTKKETDLDETGLLDRLRKFNSAIINTRVF